MYNIYDIYYNSRMKNLHLSIKDMVNNNVICLLLAVNVLILFDNVNKVFYIPAQTLNICCDTMVLKLRI